jgi:N-acetylneuraminic acid mutarotase
MTSSRKDRESIPPRRGAARISRAAIETLESRELLSATVQVHSAPPLVWTTRASAPIGLFEAHGTAVDGKLYVFGGFNTYTPQFGATNAAEAYDPATNKWAKLAPMPIMESHTAVATDGTYIYVAGGYPYNPKTGFQTFGTTDVLRYNIAKNTWSYSVPLPAPRGGGELDYLNGTLHYFGGDNGTDPRTGDRIPDNTHWILNLNSAKPQWVASAPLPLPLNHLSSVVLDGKIYSLGGRPTGADQSNPVADCLVWDPAHPKVWTPVAALLEPRAVSAAVVYNNKIYLIAGSTTYYQTIATVDVYDPTTNKWTEQTSIPAARFAPVAGVVGDTLIVTTGFSFPQGVRPRGDLGTFETTTWTATLPKS